MADPHGIAAKGTTLTGPGFAGTLTNIEVEKVATFTPTGLLLETPLVPNVLKTSLSLHLSADINLLVGSWEALSLLVEEVNPFPGVYTVTFPSGDVEAFDGVLVSASAHAPVAGVLTGRIAILRTATVSPGAMAMLSNGAVISGLDGMGMAKNIHIRGSRHYTDITDNTTTGKPKFYPELYGLEISCDLYLIDGNFDGYLSAQRAGTFVTVVVTFPDGSGATLSGYISQCGASADLGAPLMASLTFVESEAL